MCMGPFCLTGASPCSSCPLPFTAAGYAATGGPPQPPPHYRPLTAPLFTQCVSAAKQALAGTTPGTMAQTAAAVAVLPPMGAVQPPTVIDCILCDHGNTLTLFNHFFQAGGGRCCLAWPFPCGSEWAEGGPCQPVGSAAACGAGSGSGSRHCHPSLLLQAAEAGNAGVMDMCACALALDLRLHSQAWLPAHRTSLHASMCVWSCMHVPALHHVCGGDSCPLSIPLLYCCAASFLPCPQAEAQVLYPILQTRLGENGGLWAKRALAVRTPLGVSRWCWDGLYWLGYCSTLRHRLHVERSL
jgi:hypothetical protein